jgi:uncharacterized membrane protein
MTPQLTRRLFDIGVLIKGIDGVLQAIVGLALTFEGRALEEWVWMWVGNRTPWSSDDLLAIAMTHLANILSADSRKFAAYYLVSHGVVKAFLAVQLLRERMWAFPVGIAVFGIFVLYQLHRFAYTHSPAILLFSFLDLIIIALIAREWRLRSQGMPPPGQRPAAQTTADR